MKAGESSDESREIAAATAIQRQVRKFLTRPAGRQGRRKFRDATAERQAAMMENKGKAERAVPTAPTSARPSVLRPRPSKNRPPRTSISFPESETEEELASSRQLSPLSPLSPQRIDELAKPKYQKEIKYIPNTLDLPDENVVSWRKEAGERLHVAVAMKSYDVLFVSVGDDLHSIMLMVKPVMEVLGVTILEARELLDSLPAVVKSQVTYAEATKIAKGLSLANSSAVVEIREASKEAS
jgi:ribosomal protein L7/L12